MQINNSKMNELIVIVLKYDKMLSIIILKRGDNDDAKSIENNKRTEINSPSGNATEAINYVKNKVEALGYDTKTTNKVP